MHRFVQIHMQGMIIISIVLTFSLGAIAATPYSIGVVYWSMNIAGQVAMRQGLEDAVKEINRRSPSRPIRLIPFVGGDGDPGVKRQIEAMDRLIKMHPDAIILQPIDSAALSKPVIAANKAGIPVVAYDQYVLSGKLACYLTSNNYEAGHLDGEYIGFRFKTTTHQRPLRLVIVEYPFVSSTVERVEGFQDALVEAKVPYRIVGRYQAVEPVGGKAAGRRILKNHPRGSIDAIFCVNDGGGISVMRELQKAGRTDIEMATIDGDPASVAEIRKGGLIKIDSAQFAGPLGAESLRWTYRLLRGEKIPRQVLVAVFPITRRNQ
jgi:ribose transport system substrate-binding protein